MGGCLSLHWVAWEERDIDAWVVQVLRYGYQIPFHSPPPLSEDPIALPSYSLTSVRGRALQLELGALLEKGAIEPAPTSLGFYSRMFVVQKASGSWRPIIDLSVLNKSVLKTKFRMETVQSVLSSIRLGDWMCSLDLQDAYLQIPIHPESRKFLRFTTGTKVFQFKVLCFGLSTAPQVFTRVMAPVSAILHRLGIRMLRYLDDWLVLASSREECIWARDIILQLCVVLGIRVNFAKSSLVPSQTVTYLNLAQSNDAVWVWSTALLGIRSVLPHLTGQLFKPTWSAPRRLAVASEELYRWQRRPPPLIWGITGKTFI